MAVLQVEYLQKAFSGTKVLRDISFSLEEGQVLAIIGTSGSGKTTLLRCLNFLEIPDGGRILGSDRVLYAQGATLTQEALQKNRMEFGLVFQNYNLFPQYTALENVTLAPTLLKKDTPEAILCQAEKLLSQVGLSGKRDFYPWQLSGGQQQRVAIARALAMEPKVLCFDEPTSALDPELTAGVLRLIRELKDQGRTMIVVTHEMAFARQVADHVIFMAEGVIVEQGPPQKLFEEPEDPRTRAFISGAQTE